MMYTTFYQQDKLRLSRQLKRRPLGRSRVPMTLFRPQSGDCESGHRIDSVEDHGEITNLEGGSLMGNRRDRPRLDRHVVACFKDVAVKNCGSLGEP